MVYKVHCKYSLASYKYRPPHKIGANTQHLLPSSTEPPKVCKQKKILFCKTQDILLIKRIAKLTRISCSPQFKLIQKIAWLARFKYQNLN